MDRSIQQVLLSILPSLSTFPAELVDLASSILAQSRSKAPSLKQEEEIARSYACAHLACQRLKTQLDLPTITARPPCPPRVYKKLYAFLDSALPARSPRKRAREPEEGHTEPVNKARRDPGQGANAKRGRPGPSTPARYSKRRAATRTEDTDASNDYKHLLPFIRRVCDVLGGREATPHVFSALCVQAPTHEQQQLPALATALAIVVAKKMGFEMKARPFEAAAATLAEHDFILDQLEIERRPGEDLQETLSASATDLMETYESEWRQTEWFENIESLRPNLEDSAAAHAEDENDTLRVVVDDDLSAVTAARPNLGSSGRRKVVQTEEDGRLRPGLGSMFCDAVDWLSDERREAYGLWKRDILAQVESMC